MNDEYHNLLIISYLSAFSNELSNENKIQQVQRTCTFVETLNQEFPESSGLEHLLVRK
jgi:hypothetical protein